MNDFTYQYPVKIYFGEGAAAKYLPDELLKTGRNVMLAYGGGSIKRNGIYNEIMKILKDAGKNVIDFSGIMSNPTYSKIQAGAKLAKTAKIDFILAVGGGSVIDCCKIIAAQALTDEDIWDMEFTGRRFPENYLPMGAIVTASGTGAEQNDGAVITNEEKKIKASLYGAYAKFAVLDPSYTLSVPFKQVISGAFDTLSHAMETYLGQPAELTLSDEFSEAVMRNVIRNIRILLKNPEDMSARRELMWGSAMAENRILKIGKIPDFQAHQIEHQLGAYTDCNHGHGLAVIHPVLYRRIYKDGLKKFKRLAMQIWEISPEDKTDEEIALSGIEAFAGFIKELGLPTTLTEMGITDTAVLKSVADSCNISTGCCKTLSHNEIFEILKECL